MSDLALEAQALMDSNENNPKEGIGGEVSAKPPHLEREAGMLYLIVGLLVLGLAFALGFYLGKISTERDILKTRVGQLESAKIEHKNNLEYAPPATTKPLQPQTVKHTPQSAVLHYKDPKEQRTLREREALAAIDREIEGLKTGKGALSL